MHLKTEQRDLLTSAYSDMLASEAGTNGDLLLHDPQSSNYAWSAASNALAR
jgi:hypothetical protein